MTLENIWPAHIRVESDGNWCIQTVQEHNDGTAAGAKLCLLLIGLGTAAWIAGEEHDDGKRTKPYKIYIIDAASGKPVKRGSVIHSFTGVRFLLEQFHENQPDIYSRLTAELIAYAVGAHHGLFDTVDENGASGFMHRMHFPDEPYCEAIRNRQIDGNTIEALEDSFHSATQEITNVVNRLLSTFFMQHEGKKIAPGHADELDFYFGLLARLLTSAVIEGDRRDTAIFMRELNYPLLPEDRRTIWEQCLYQVEQKLAQLQSSSSGKPITDARAKISALCMEKAREPGGVFRLNVPTGAGKTLSSLRFALAHAKERNSAHIIITTPLLSILEQNAATIHEFVGHDEWILEHHSNVVRESGDGEEAVTRELLEESWSAPIILTTLVQLLNTLFSHKTSSVRRFQSLCNSVIVIDEVQTVPLKMLSLFNLAVNFLTTVCGTTIVLCSATQPCLEETPHPIQVPVRDMVPYSEELWRPFHRTELVDGGKRRLEDIPTFVHEIMKSTSSLLIVCNKKAQARTLLCLLKDQPWQCFHLSAAMCPAHRTKVVEQMKRTLEAIKQGSDQKLVCVSTQVIEAGVDISFTCVIRFMAGMDNAVQAAGRCNRNGESDGIRPVYLVDCTDEELGRLREIQGAKTASEELLDDFRKNPNKFQDGLSGDIAIREYYHVLYRALPGEYQDFSVDGDTIYRKLAGNRHPEKTNEDRFTLCQAFLTAGKQFRVFDENTEAVLVPYGKGKELILELNSARAERDLAYTGQLLEKAKPYFINLYTYQLEQLEKKGMLYADKWNRVRMLEEGCYQEDVGFTTSDIENPLWEV